MGLTTMGPYLPLVLMFALAAGFALFSVTARPTSDRAATTGAKLDAYECGIEPSPQPVVGAAGCRSPTTSPRCCSSCSTSKWSSSTRSRSARTRWGVFGLVEIVLFIVTVGFAYIYVWRRGGLDWN